MYEHEKSIKIVDLTKDKTVCMHKKGSGFFFCPLLNKTGTNKTENKNHKGFGRKSGRDIDDKGLIFMHFTCISLCIFRTSSLQSTVYVSLILEQIVFNLQQSCKSLIT